MKGVRANMRSSRGSCWRRRGMLPLTALHNDTAGCEYFSAAIRNDNAPTGCGWPPTRLPLGRFSRSSRVKDTPFLGPSRRGPTCFRTTTFFYCFLWFVVLTLTRTIKSVVTGQAPATLELRNTPGKKHKQTEGGTRIYHS